MPDDQGRLFASDIAEQIGISPSDFRARVSRGHAPAPVAYVPMRSGGPRAVWDPKTVADYIETRASRLAWRDDQPADETS